MGQHLLVRRLLRCSCGSAMSPRTFRRDGREVYRCLNRHEYAGSERCTMPHVPREEVDAPLLDYFMTVVVDLDATREQLRNGHSRQLDEAQALAAEAESALANPRRLDRVEREYLAGAHRASGTTDLARSESERAAAQAEAERHRAHVAEVEADTAIVDAEEDMLRRLADVRAAVVSRVRDAEGVDALRAALTATFERIDLHVIDGRTFLLPYLREDAIVSTDPHDLVEPRRVPLQMGSSTWAKTLG